MSSMTCRCGHCISTTHNLHRRGLHPWAFPPPRVWGASLAGESRLRLAPLATRKASRSGKERQRKVLPTNEQAQHAPTTHALTMRTGASPQALVNMDRVSRQIRRCLSTQLSSIERRACHITRVTDLRLARHPAARLRTTAAALSLPPHRASLPQKQPGPTSFDDRRNGGKHPQER